MSAPRLSLLVFAKNEANRLPGAIAPLSALVSGDIVVVADVDSVDATLAVADGLADRVYRVRFADSFGDLLTMGFALAGYNADYVLYLDADERLDPGAFAHLRDKVISPGGKGPIYALARKRWSDWQKSRQIDPDDPDWQVRLLPVRDPPVRFERRLHPRPAPGSPDVVRLLHGPAGKDTEVWPWIDHFHDTKTPAELETRRVLYRKLALADGIAVEGGQAIQAVCAWCDHARGDHAGCFDYARPPFRCDACPAGTYTYCPGFLCREA